MTDLELLADDLLEFIDEGKVVPVIGSELITVTAGGTTMPLETFVAQKLAERLRIDTGRPGPPTLADVVLAHLRNRGRREDLYPRVRALLKEAALEPPPALRKLAEIERFDLFVTLGFDSLLVDALNAVRFGGKARTLELAYSPTTPQDLPASRRELTAPVVYHLLGRLSASPDYAVTEEDLLEFMLSLQSESRRPPLLFDELAGSHLLIMGCSYPDWLARFFIRIAKSRQLSAQRGETEILVHPNLDRQPDLVVFLENFSYSTRLVQRDAESFVDDLHRRWRARHPARPAAEPAPGGGEAGDEMEAGAVFVSYAKEDVAAVERLKTALEAAGVDVWFDKRRLEAGDEYDRKIRRNIRNCSLFLPVISANTERRLEGYFRREWRWAEERAEGIAANVPFLLPVVIDETAEYSDAVPEIFQRVQWTRLSAGAATAEFTARLVKLVRDYRKRERGLA